MTGNANLRYTSFIRNSIIESPLHTSESYRRQQTDRLSTVIGNHEQGNSRGGMDESRSRDKDKVQRRACDTSVILYLSMHEQQNQYIKPGTGNRERNVVHITRVAPSVNLRSRTENGHSPQPRARAGNRDWKSIQITRVT